jgi:hypothetical protein
MDIDEESAAILDILGHALSLPKLQFDDGDSAAFALDNRLVIQLSLDRVAEEIVVGVIFGIVPTDYADARFLRRLLGANYYWHQTQGGTIGLDETSGALTLAYRVGLPMLNRAQIEDIVAKLAGAADAWRSRLSEAGEPPQEPPVTSIRV